MDLGAIKTLQYQTDNYQALISVISWLWAFISSFDIIRFSNFLSLQFLAIQ